MKQLKKRFNKFVFLLPRVILVLVLLASTGIVILGSFDMYEPYFKPLHATRMKKRTILPLLTIGPYPHEQELRQLKKDGHTTLISLLDTRLPQERALLRLEQRMANSLGMELASFPLSYLPVESDANLETVARVHKFVQDRPGVKIYMHCYLGRHRVEYVRKSFMSAEGGH